MFLVLSMTASGSVLALAVLWLRRKWGRRLAGAERWLWLIVLLRLCIPLPGPLNLMGEAFVQIQGRAQYLYASVEEAWIVDPDRGGEVVLAAMQRAADAAPEDVERLPLGAYTPEAPIRIPLPGWFRLLNPNTWLAVWAAGAAARLCWALLRRGRRPRPFGWFAEIVLSLHWFNPLMVPVRRALAETPAREPVGRAGRRAAAALAAAGLCLGVLPGGLGMDLFQGAERQLVFDLNAVSITGREALDRFVEKTERGHPAFLRVIKLFEEDEPLSVPARLWLYDVYFDGKLYYSFEPGGDIDFPYKRITYPYLVREEREVPTNEEMELAVSYVLTDNPEADWLDRFLQSSGVKVEHPVTRAVTLVNYYMYK